MPRTHLTCLLLVACSAATALGDRPLVIAHRGASGYLPEHTLAAKALAYAMRADFIEQDVVLTKDDHPVVLHDVHLDTVTNVAQVFPGRGRPDGRYYAIDFTLAEIKTLHVTERIDLDTNQAVYPQRFPVRTSRFAVPTLSEEIELIQGLNKSTGRSVGIYVEIKSPAWHREQGKDISRMVLDMLARFGYVDREDAAYVQCFDAAETRRLRQELGTKLKLVQLIGDNEWNESATDFDALRTPAGIREIATYAAGIGPWLPHVVSGVDGQGRAETTDLVQLAHAAGLVVHPFTFRKDALPEYTKDFKELLRIFLDDANVDGVFTDFPDLAARFVHTRAAAKSP